ncbi:MAG: hypothetical protein IPN29_09380 [Saprospiraceae bacterium]|nr:hypothetical protein [Saprospiraceae bacterium]
MADLYFKIPKISSTDWAPKGETLIILPAVENTEAHLGFIKAITAALKLSAETDFTLMVVPAEGIMLGRMMSSFSYTLIMGVAPEDLHLNLTAKAHKVYFLEGSRLLFTYAPSALLTDQLKKAALWKSLQLMYGLATK